MTMNPNFQKKSEVEVMQEPSDNDNLARPRKTLPKYVLRVKMIGAYQNGGHKPPTTLLTFS